MTTTAFAFGSPPTQGGQLSERGIKLVHNIISCCGAVAQLGERRVRNAKVGSSILLGSTIFPQKIQRSSVGKYLNFHSV